MGKFVNNLNTLKKGSSEWKDAFASIRKSLDGLTVDEALEKLQKLKVNPELQEGLLKSAKRADILKGTTKEIEDGIKKVGQSTDLIDDLSLGFKGLWATMKPILISLATNPMTWVVAASALAVIIDSKLNPSLEKSKEKLEETQSKLSEVNSQIDENINKIKELESLDSLSITDEEDLKRLKAENKELEIRQAYLERLEELDKQQVVDSAKREYNQQYGQTGEKISEGRQLSNDIAEYKRYQDKKKQAESIEDEIKAGKALEKWNNKLEKTEEKLIESRQELQTLRDELMSTGESSEELDSVNTQLKQIDDLLKISTNDGEQLKEELENVADTANKIDDSNIFELKDAEGNLTTLGKLSESIDKIQNAYKTLYSAIEEYNSEGAISVDTLQSVIALGDDWLDYLVDEQGNLKLDQQALQDLTASRLNDMRVQAINNVIDNVSKVNDEITAKEYLASTNYALAESYEELAEKKLEDLQLSLTLKGLDSGTIDSVMSKASADISKINKLFDNTNISSSSIIGGSSSSKSEKKWKDYLDKLLSSYEAELELGLIDFENFTDKSFDLVEKFYREGKITAEEYWDSINRLYEKQLNIYDKVISAVTRRIDKEIEGIEDIIDGLEDQNDVLEKQLDDYDGILSAVEEVYDKEIERLESEKDLLQDKIDALNDEADAYELVRKKEEALYALEQAQKNRTKKIYVEGKGYIYDQDHEAIRNAQDDLHDIETEEAINKLEKEQEIIDKTIDTLEEYKQKWAEISDVYEKEVNRQLAIALWGKDYESMILQNRIEDIDTFKNSYVGIQKQVDDNQSLIDSYNEKVEYYQKLKDQWADIADVYEQSIEDQYTAMILGQDWEKQILDERSLKLEEFKTTYVTLQETMAQAAMDSAKKQAEAAKIASDAATNLLASKLIFDDINESNSSSDTPKKYRVVRVSDGFVESDGYTDSFEAYKYIANMEKWNPIKGKYKVEAYSKGGLIDKKKSPLDVIAKQVGEDKIIAVKEGERVLTPVQNEIWEKALPNLQEFAKTINFMPNIKMPDYSHLSGMIQHQSQQPIVQNFNITMPNVTNNTSADRIMRDLQRLPLDAYQYSRRR